MQMNDAKGTIVSLGYIFPQLFIATEAWKQPVVCRRETHPVEVDWEMHHQKDFVSLPSLYGICGHDDNVLLFFAYYTFVYAVCFYFILYYMFYWQIGYSVPLL